MIHAETILKSFADAKAGYEQQPARDASIICRAGPHMDCAVVKLQKPEWTNDDLTKMGNRTGIFFSIWVGEAGAAKGRADYNIHAMSVRKLKSYRLTGNEFSDRFRKAFNKVRAGWPNVSTDYGCCTLMQGWYDINPKSFASDAMKLMRQFDKQVAPIIDRLLDQSRRAGKSARAAVA
jgi:hypothetical protein